jgi:two-component system, OmpR family, response regulator
MSSRERKAGAVLIVSGDAMHREALRSAVWQSGWMPQVCQTAEEAAQILQPHSFAAVLSDDVLPDADFTVLVREIERRSLHVPVVVVSRRDECDLDIVALTAEAANYLAFPPYPGEVERSHEPSMCADHSQKRRR